MKMNVNQKSIKIFFEFPFFSRFLILIFLISLWMKSRKIFTNAMTIAEKKELDLKFNDRLMSLHS